MIIVLNHKCNLEYEEFLKYKKNLETNIDNKDIIICPSFIYLPLLNNDFKLGAQNVSHHSIGAYTGEVSAKQLKSLNVSYTIVGHSERRGYNHETNEEINQKIKQLLKYNITPILCVGETLEEKEKSITKEIIQEEILTALKEISSEEINNIIIAYEPIWAIGTGKIPTNSEIEDVIDFIKGILPHNKVLYGGSVNEENIHELQKVKLIDGYLLGGLSLKIDKLKIFLENII